MASELFLNMVAAIYDAGLQPEAWPNALSLLGNLLGSTWLMISALRFSGEADLVAQDLNGEPEAFALFRQRYNSADTNPAIPALLASQPGTINLREQHITDEEWHRSGLYRELYRPTGNYYGLAALVLKTDSHIVPLGVNRPKKGGAFTSRETELLSQALPHLQRAMQVYLRLADLQSHKTAHEGLWDTLAFGVILLDREGKVLWTNQAATTILMRCDGLSVRKGSLAAASPSENARLQQLTRMAVATSDGRSALPHSSLSVSRPSLARPLALLMAPIRMERPFARQPVAVVFVTDPEQKSEAPPEMLKRLYGLTSREAAVAALLLQGIDLREAASQLGVTMHTARTHLRLIFEKTNTHRQGELIRLLLQGPAGIV